MEEHTWRIQSRLHSWSASRPDTVKQCEYCTAYATYSSVLVDNEQTERELHWHCDSHQPDAIGALDEVRYEGLTWVFNDRHWMHIWKVGYKACASCNRDSRVIASLLDAEREIIEQRLYCEGHAPWKGNSGRGTNYPADPISRINLELGATFFFGVPPESDD